jgi:hypothetical protein
MIYILSFIKIGSGIQKLIGGCPDKQTRWRAHKATLIFKNKESRLKVYFSLQHLPCNDQIYEAQV